MIRRHDVQVLAEGTFRVLLTSRGRLAMVIELQDSALGPLHLLFEVSLEPAVPAIQTGALFGGLGRSLGHAAHDVGHAVGHVAGDVAHMAGGAAEHTFDAASKVATTVARPAFNLARDAAASGAHLLASAPFIPEAERKRIEAAARVIMRARLGDVTAKQFIRDVVRAARAGVRAAQHAADALLSGTSIVAHVLDAPLALAAHVPLIGGALHSLSPFQKLERMVAAVRHGDFEAMKRIVTEDVRLAEGVVSLVPGIGSGIGAAIGTGLAVLDGGGPLDIAIHAAYGAIPIPPGIRDITDAVLESVLSLTHHKSLTDAAIAAARNAVPAGLPRDVFDTLAQLVVKRVPVKRAAEALVAHYVQRYAPELPSVDLPKGLEDAAAHVADIAHAASPVGVVAHVAAVAQHLDAAGDVLSAIKETTTPGVAHALQAHVVPALLPKPIAGAAEHVLQADHAATGLKGAADLGAALPAALHPPPHLLPAGPTTAG